MSEPILTFEVDGVRFAAIDDRNPSQLDERRQDLATIWAVDEFGQRVKEFTINGKKYTNRYPIHVNRSGPSDTNSNTNNAIWFIRSGPNDQRAVRDGDRLTDSAMTKLSNSCYVEFKDIPQLDARELFEATLKVMTALGRQAGSKAYQDSPFKANRSLYVDSEQDRRAMLSVAVKGFESMLAEWMKVSS